jgi:hypothetical protein
MTQSQFRVVALGLGISILLSCASGPVFPDLFAENVVSVEAWGVDTPRAKVANADKEGIENLVRVVQAGEPTGDHKCRSSHMLVLHLADGNAVKLGLLSGHTEGYLEYRFYRGDGYSVFRVNRDELLDALGTLGIVLDLNTPE